MTPDRRNKTHAATRQEIIAIAWKQIAENGASTLSLRAIARAMEMTAPALYRYFPSKDALLSKLVARILEDVRALLDRAEGLLPASASPLTRVFALVHGYRAFARLEPHRFGLLAMTMAEPRVLLQQPEDAEPVVFVMMAALQRLADALGAAAEAGQLEAGELPERTLCVFAMLQGLLQLQKQARYAPGVLDVDRLTVHGTRSLLLGWGAKPRTVDAAIARVAALGDLTQRLGGAA